MLVSCGGESLFPDAPDLDDLVALGDAAAEAVGLAEIDGLHELPGAFHRGVELGRGGGAGGRELLIAIQIAGFRGITNDEEEIPIRHVGSEITKSFLIARSEFAGTGDEVERLKHVRSKSRTEAAV